MSSKRKCPHCDDTGIVYFREIPKVSNRATDHAINPKAESCPTCNGTGWYRRKNNHRMNDMQKTMDRAK